MALLLLLVSELSAQSASSVERSVVVLLDASYSMALRSARSGQRRIDVAMRAARELVRRASPGEEWALIVMEDRSTIEVASAFFTDPASRAGWRQGFEPGGSSPLGAALERAASYLSTEGRGSARCILLISDGIATEDDAFRLPNPEYFSARAISIVALVCGAPEVDQVQAELRAFAARAGGASFDAEEVVGSGAYSSVLAELRRAVPAQQQEKPLARPPEPAPVPTVEALRVAPAAAKETRLAGIRAWGTGSGARAASASARVQLATLHRTSTRMERSSTVAPGAQLSFRVIWLALPLMLLAAWRLARRIRDILKSLGAPRSTVSYQPVLRVEVRSRGSSSGVAVLRALPALVGGSEGAHLRLDPRPGSPARPDFELDVTPSGAVMRSPVPLNVNGVARTHKLLRPGDSVAYNGHRIVFRELGSERVVVRRAASSSGFPWELALLGGSLLAGLLFWRPLTITLPRRVVAREPVVEESSVLLPVLALAQERGGTASPGQGGGSRPAAATGRASAGSSALPVSLRLLWHAPVEKQQSSAAPASVAAEPPRDVPLYLEPVAPRAAASVTVYAPGQPIDYSPVDALFIHAHPDDESIDFGVLLARLSAAGRRSAVVLLTDGESGLDQYPDRATGGMYAKRGLLPVELGAIRPLEARSALETLGASVYVRLGLKNHPYASSRQELALATLLADWGGEDAVVSRLVDIIEGFRPTIVVSPDAAHNGAHEHFEHAGTGYLVQEALRRVRERGRHTVLAHLRSVDPRFLDAYSGEEGINALETVPGGTLTLRALQVRALKEHQTQRDATVVAVENLTSQGRESYVSTFQRDPLPLDGLLRKW